MLPVCNQSEQEYLLCLKRYITMGLYQYDEAQIKALLQMFHRPETVNELYYCLEKKRNPLERFTLHCDMNCKKNCPIINCCLTQKTAELSNMITEKLEAMSFEESAEKLNGII